MTDPAAVSLPPAAAAPAESESERMASRLRLLHAVTAPSAEPLQARLTRALALTATLLDLDSGVFSHVVGDVYTVVAVSGPASGATPGATFSLGETYCAIALEHDDVLAVHHMGASAYGDRPCYVSHRLERYIGIPVRVSGEVYGTLCFSARARGAAPYGESDHDLLRVLATWISGTLEQEAQQRALAEQAALVRGLYDASPLMMGVAELTADGDILHRSDNAAAAAFFGRTPASMRDRLASELGFPAAHVAVWADAYRRTAAEGRPVRFEGEVEGPDGPCVLAAAVSLVAEADPVLGLGERFCYAIEDVTEQRAAQRALAASERRTRVLTHATFEGLAFARGGVILDANEQFAHLFGFDSSAALIGLDAAALVAPESLPLVKRMIAEGRADAYEAEMLRPDGSRFWADVQGQMVPFTDGEPARVTAIRDVTRRKLAEQQLHFQADVLAHVSDAVVALDLDGCVTYWNAGAERLHGFPAETVLGRPLESVVRYTVPDPAAAPPGAAVRSAPDALRTAAGGDLIYEAPGGGRRIVSVSASLLRDGGADGGDEGHERGVLAVLRDVTAERELAARMEHQALHDSLTGLPNRARFREHVEAALRRGDAFSVLYVDLDRFKTVNDTLGHDAGDRLLLAVAGRMQAAAGAGALVARLGGDEFGIAVPGDRRAGTRAGQYLLTALRAPVALGRREVVPGASVGLVARAERYTDPEALLRDADTAMYHAKRAGRDRLSVFDETMHRTVAERFTLEHDLRQALRTDQFCIRLQPIVDLTSGAVAGFEALARWEHPSRGLLGPSAFIELAEELGLIAEIDGRVLDQTCAEMGRWASQGPRGLGDMLTMVNVNCSDQSFLDAGLAGRARAAADAASIPPGCLTLELTERALVANEVAGGLADAIRAAGLKLCVDDFGSGYSSLGLLHRLPVDGLKIDRSFVTDLGHSPPAQAVVRAVVQFSADLGLRTVAEGIETPAQLRVLRNLGCRYGQGFLFSPPVTPDVARTMLDAAPWAAQWPFG
ncbi:MAG TPA: EAL domain-containing protein [Rubricoccaceae bacterium]